MGKSSSKAVAPKLKQSEIKEFARQSLFSEESVQKLFFHFHRISTSEIDDGVIDYSEFCLTLKRPTQSFLAERIFYLFDANRDGVINFREFLLGLSTFNQDGADRDSRQTRMLATMKLNDQIDISFTMLDIDRVGKIHAKDLRRLLKTAVDESGIQLTKKEVKLIVNRTISGLPYQEDETGRYIDKDTYKRMVLQHPGILRWLSVDLDRMNWGPRTRHKDSKKRCLSL